MILYVIVLSMNDPMLVVHPRGSQSSFHCYLIVLRLESFVLGNCNKRNS